MFALTNLFILAAVVVQKESEKAIDETNVDMLVLQVSVAELGE